MKGEKMKLDDLKVKSFVTSVSDQLSQVLGGGNRVPTPETAAFTCQTNLQGPCQPSEYMTACMSLPECIEDKEKEKIRLP